MVWHYGICERVIEKIFSEECDRLASTIGRVMEEAGDRVDNNIDELKREYTDKLRKMEILLKKVHTACCMVPLFAN